MVITGIIYFHFAQSYTILQERFFSKDKNVLQQNCVNHSVIISQFHKYGLCRFQNYILQLICQNSMKQIEQCQWTQPTILAYVH